METDVQLLSDGTSGFRWTGVLDTYDLDKIWNAAQIIFLVLFACQAIYLDCDGRIRFLLFCVPWL